jgi:glycosyltransferase involved in cell wall biosynthesis
VSNRRIKLAVVANEHFDPSIGRAGGFGWAAAATARLFLDRPELGVDPVFFTGEIGPRNGADEILTGGVRLLCRTEGYRARLRREAPDLLLLVDYRPDYWEVLNALPRTPFILWVRDPRDPSDVAKVASLRNLDGSMIPGQAPIDCRSFAGVARRAFWFRRRWTFAVVSPFLQARIEGTYGVAPRTAPHLPNPLVHGALPAQRAARPRVLFLGRLDPVKRPWLLLEIARRMPEVDFQVLGSGDFGSGAVPGNLRLCGHVDGPGKTEALANAWLLINTSIHEGLAVSFLEALANEVPIVSCQDSEGVASRFGRYVGRFDGSGAESIAAFVEAIRQLIGDPGERSALGQAGRAWVERTHSPEAFLAAFRTLAAHLRVPLRP